MPRGRKTVVLYERICVDCKETKSIEFFPKWRKICRDCLNANKRARRKVDPDFDEPRSQNLHRSRSWYWKNRESQLKKSKKNYKDNLDFASNLKASTPCKDCGLYFDPICMDFDHLNSLIKVGKVSELVKGNRATLITEIAKCEIVCSNCHRLRTKIRKRDHSKP